LAAAAASSSRASAASDRSNRARRRAASMALKRPVETSQARGLAGTPSRAHCSTAFTNASCIASSARSKSPSRRMSVGQDAARLETVDLLDSRAHVRHRY
jgi:hypothetical protein